MPSRLPFAPLPIDHTDVTYLPGPDSLPRDGVDPGETIEIDLGESVAYPGTRRRCWVHVPAGHDPTVPANVVVFNDGWWYLDPEGDVRAAVALDNVVASGDIPMTIGVFVDPATDGITHQPDFRRLQYDAFDDRYAGFLLDEVLPVVGARFALTDDPGGRAICGGSCGGDAAFTVGWFRPDGFGRVLGFLSSFAQMPGGNPYPRLIPATPPKPLRIFLQAAHRDLGWNQPTMNWLAENLRVGAALAEAGYDFRLVLGDGGHSANHTGVLLPDALRWVFRAA